MTNQEIECTCRVEARGLPGEVEQQIIIHGPCHSPGLEVWAERDTLLARNEELERKVAVLVRALKGCNNVITSHLMADGVLPPSAQDAYRASCNALADIEGEGE